MFKSIVQEYLDNTKYSQWSIVSILNYVRSKQRLYIHDADDLKSDVYAVLQ
jgi:hypothetical protein